MATPHTRAPNPADIELQGCNYPQVHTQVGDGIVRDVQLSLIEGMDRPTGPLVKSLVLGDNADLMVTIAPLYLTGRVLDTTYGRGMWWRRHTPPQFLAHDLYTLDGVDFRRLPHPDASFDTVCFDAPYVPRHGNADATVKRDQDFRDRFGLDRSRTLGELKVLMRDGLVECARVSRRWLLVKCCDFTSSRKFEPMSHQMMTLGDELGLVVHDIYVLGAGTGPGGNQITRQVRSRRAHSYLIVFDTRRMHRRRPATATAGPVISDRMEQLRAGHHLEDVDA